MNPSGYQDLLNQSYLETGTIVITNLILPNLDPNSVPIIDSDNGVTDIILNNGELLIGRTGQKPNAQTLTGTTDEVIVTNGSGTITLSTPQDIAPTSSPTFNNLTLTTLNNIPISDFFINPSTQDLDMNSHDIINVDKLNTIPMTDYITTPSTQDLDMNSHAINNVTTINSKNVNDIVTSASNGSNNIVAVYSGTSKAIQSSGVLITDLVTQTDLSSKVSKSGDSMSGNLNMTGNQITNIDQITTVADNVTIGLFNPFPTSGFTVMIGHLNTLSYSTPPLFNVNIGNFNDLTAAGSLLIGSFNKGGGATSLKSTLVGYSNDTSGSINGQSVIYGSDNSDSNNAGGCFIFGFSNTNADGQRNILIGRNLNVLSGINDAYVLGHNVTNNTSQSLIVGNTGFTNIRAGSTICDLGTTSNRFKDCHLSGSLVGTTKTSAVNSIVTGPASVTADMVASFDGTTGKLIKSSGVLVSDLITDNGGVIFGQLTSNLNILARNQPCTLSKFTQYNSVTLTNSTTPLSIFNANSVGSTVYTANTTNIGMVVKIRAWFQINGWGGGGTLSIILYVNAAPMAPLTIPSPPTNLFFHVEFDLTVRPGNIYRCQGMAILSGGNNIIIDSGGAWNPTSSQAIGVSMQWSVASGSNTVSALTANIESHYQL